MNHPNANFQQSDYPLHSLRVMLKPLLNEAVTIAKGGHLLLIIARPEFQDSLSWIDFTENAVYESSNNTASDESIAIKQFILQFLGKKDTHHALSENQVNSLDALHFSYKDSQYLLSTFLIPVSSRYLNNYLLMFYNENEALKGFAEGQFHSLINSTEMKNTIERWESLQTNLFNNLFGECEDILIVADSMMQILHVNRAAEVHFDSRLEQMYGMNFSEMVNAYHCKSTNLQDLFKYKPLKIKEKQSFEVTYGKKGLLESEMLLQMQPIGEGLILLRMHDITFQKRQLQLLLEEKLRAEDSDRLKMAFLANMSHEIRTPLNSIIGFSELLLEEEPDQNERIAYYEMIKSAGGTLLQLIEDIIDISKIEAGHIKISKSETDINALLDEVYTIFENERIKRHKTDVSLQLVKAVQGMSFFIQTDPFRIRQILNNLLSNAIKFIDKGLITFGYKAADPGFVQFFVRDTGIGIPREQAHFIFQRFGQIDPSHRNKEGTGLGLSITKHLVELLGGQIWFDSEEGKGTTFYFTLPAEYQKRAFQDAYKATVSADTDWSSHVFLIVDDVEANFVFYKAILKHTGALLLWARDGNEAVKICRNNDAVSLVLMDLQMPQLSGYEASQQIKIFAPQLPIIAQTAFADVEGREKAIAAGCDDYITKPINQQELVELIRNFLYRATE